MAPARIRFDRLRRPSGTIIMVPMDHGISMGPLPGLVDAGATMAAVADHATCFTVHKGLIRYAAEHARDVGVLLHLSGSTDLAPDTEEKRLVASVEEAMRRGCDGVSTHLNLGSRTEADQLEALGGVSEACHDWGMPHLAMVYPRGPGVRDPYAPELVAHAARLAAELGADAVKVPYTGAKETFGRVVAGAGIPVIVAGGPKQPDQEAFLQSLRDAKAAGASGVSIGRNVFQADDPGAAIQAISDIFP